MPQVEQPRKRWPKVARVSLVVLVVVGLPVGYLVYRLVPTAAASNKQAVVYMNNNDFARAYKVLEGAYKRAILLGDKKLLRGNLEIAAASTGHGEEALGYLKQIRNDDPSDYSAQENVADMELQLHDYSAAAADYQHILDLVSNHTLTPPAVDATNYIKSQLQAAKAGMK
jgi:tetratricopeptide (TPR) repeat protein